MGRIQNLFRRARGSKLFRRRRIDTDQLSVHASPPHPLANSPGENDVAVTHNSVAPEGAKFSGQQTHTSLPDGSKGTRDNTISVDGEDKNESTPNRSQMGLGDRLKGSSDTEEKDGNSGDLHEPYHGVQADDDEVQADDDEVQADDDEVQADDDEVQADDEGYDGDDEGYDGDNESDGDNEQNGHLNQQDSTSASIITIDRSSRAEALDQAEKLVTQMDQVLLRMKSPILAVAQAVIGQSLRRLGLEFSDLNIDTSIYGPQAWELGPIPELAAKLQEIDVAEVGRTAATILEGVGMQGVEPVELAVSFGALLLGAGLTLV